MMFVGKGADSIEDMLSGYVHANAELVALREGAVVRREGTPAGHVAVVAGGGGGHYPGFAGWVGAGMLDAAVSGQIFSSPSAAQIHRAALAVENGGGVLLAYLNYSGDRIHFGEAARQLRAEGIAVEEVVIADDIASRTSREVADGRGIAGALFVCKVLGAAAAEGRGLEEVAHLGTRAAERTVSLGAAVSGCTLPGDSEPLFTVEKGQLAIGLGIHGEPGLETQEQGTPSDLARRLVAATLDYEPEAGHGGYEGRLAVLVNSLGGCSHEELFVLYARVREELATSGQEIVAPVVGEQLTSLDMVGASLSTMFLDADLEALWSAPVRTASLRRETLPTADEQSAGTVAAGADAPVQASRAQQELAARARAAIGAAAEAVAQHEERLAQLDRVGGDGDHGRGMVRGLAAAHEAATSATEAGAAVGAVVRAAGAAWSDKAGGTSGALWGAALEAFASALGDVRPPTDAELVDGLTRARDAIVELGGARPGDKTMVDAIEPFVQVFEAEPDAPFAQTLVRATAVAEAAAEATADLVATKGRARTHGTRTIGTPDAGAVSFGIVARAVAESLQHDPAAAPAGEPTS
ncbi:dihydroxyacetone kinase family protein [Occultella gossypii]|uniref:Dihydroxyacetone kinase subunit DhaK n=1 Tax=Occultella gossypii TaxID=2800820 RepID=A0ABS7SDG1_9MICO|nr:dihydroxyacetone kinase family protein [Occultella gossypii]MBZ2197938.1 dihydroxyacetone kinase subunit DhaK [Occultella gossypii]